jgi:hypothetical protein
MKKSDDILPPEASFQVEDIITEDLDDHAAPSDDSDIPIQVLLGQMMERKLPEGFSIVDTLIVAECVAEEFEDEAATVVVVEEEELGRGKRRRRPNQLYSRKTFWRHDDNEDDIGGQLGV